MDVRINLSTFRMKNVIVSRWESVYQKNWFSSTSEVRGIGSISKMDRGTQKNFEVNLYDTFLWAVHNVFLYQSATQYFAC